MKIYMYICVYHPCKISTTDSVNPGAQNDHVVEKTLGFYKMLHLGGQICTVLRVDFEHVRYVSKNIIYLGGSIL